MKVKLYTKPGCGPCRATKHALESRGIPFDAIDVMADDADLEAVKGLGYLTVPVVLVTERGQVEHWGGFQIDRIADLAARWCVLDEQIEDLSRKLAGIRTTEDMGPTSTGMNRTCAIYDMTDMLGDTDALLRQAFAYRGQPDLPVLHHKLDRNAAHSLLDTDRPWRDRAIQALMQREGAQ